MSKGYALVGVIMLALLALGVVNIVNNYASSNELDVSLLRDTVEAAMYDSVDLGYYRVSKGIIRMDKEKFAENFTKRFAESAPSNRNYKIRLIDINETPPKVTVMIGSSTVATFAGEDFDIVNVISGILETKYDENRLFECIKKNPSGICTKSQLDAIIREENNNE